MHSPLTSALASGNSNSSMSPSPTAQNVQGKTAETHTQILSRPRLQDLVREVDATEQLDEEVEELLLQLADDFVESTVNAACTFAKHRHANTVDIKDVQLHLERNWNMSIPGFGTDELKPYKRSAVTEAHKQRMALIRKALKKY
ncbi:UNVERIFIED_CONTAM: hypothetical protein PYX00_003549 [Menopon gallinae]